MTFKSRQSFFKFTFKKQSSLNVNMEIIASFINKTPSLVGSSLSTANKIINTVKCSFQDKLSMHYFSLESQKNDISIYKVYQNENYSYSRFAPLKKEDQIKTLNESEKLIAKWNNLWRLSFGEQNSYTLHSIPFEKVYVMEDKNATIAIAGYNRMNHNIIHVQSMAVNPLYRRCGYGTSILLEIVRSNPDTIILLGVLKDAPTWQHVYNRHGFRKIDSEDIAILESSGSWLLTKLLNRSDSFMILNPYIKQL